MFETMKLAAILAKGYSGDATALPAMQALKMATAEGAAFSGRRGWEHWSRGLPRI